MPEIEFQVNEFRVYKVNVDGVSFGFIDTGTGGYVPKMGESFQYDGDTVILKDGREFTGVPQLRGAITGGWCILANDEVTRYKPKAAGIQVRATEHRGTDRPVKVSVETVQAEEREVVSVADRKRRREATNEGAARRVPMESDEGRAVMAKGPAATGDDDLDEVLSAIEEEMENWVGEQQAEGQRVEDDLNAEEEAKAQVEASILEMLNSVEDDPPPAPRRAAPRRSARTLPVDAEEERVVMPIVREEDTEVGTVVGNIGNKPKVIVERDAEIAMNVSRATPEGTSPKPTPRFGGAGVIVVDEQRDMGKIVLSGSAQGPIRLDESAKVQPGNTESIRMGDGAQVGTRKTAGKAPVVTGPQEGVAVGRVMTPTHQSFTATDSNTSSTAIQRTQEGKRMRVERYEADDQVVGTVSEGTTAKAVATGDVQEARTGDDLTDVLPDAAVGPVPEVHRRPEDDPAYAAVKMMIPEFEWNKDRKVSERVTAAMKHIKNPLYIKGILAVETKLACEEIKKALAVELGKRSKKKAKKKAKKSA